MLPSGRPAPSDPSDPLDAAWESAQQPSDHADPLDAAWHQAQRGVATDPLDVAWAQAQRPPTVRPELRGRPLVLPTAQPDLHGARAQLLEPAARDATDASLGPPPIAGPLSSRTGVRLPPPAVLASLVQPPVRNTNTGSPIVEPPSPAQPPTPPDAGARANMDVGHPPAPEGSVEDQLVKDLHEHFKLRPEDLEPASRLGKAAFMAGRMATDPKLIGLALASTVVGPEVWALAGIPGGATLGAYTGQQVRRARDRAAGQAETDFGHDAVSNRDAAFALGQVFATSGLPIGLKYLDHVIGRGAAASVEQAIADGASTPAAALMRGLTARVVAHSAAGGAGGYVFTPDDPETGALVGAIMGGVHATLKPQRIVARVPERAGLAARAPASATAAVDVEQTPAGEAEPIDVTLARAKETQRAPDMEIPTNVRGTQPPAPATEVPPIDVAAGPKAVARVPTDPIDKTYLDHLNARDDLTPFDKQRLTDEYWRGVDRHEAERTPAPKAAAAEENNEGDRPAEDATTAPGRPHANREAERVLTRLDAIDADANLHGENAAGVQLRRERAKLNRSLRQYDVPARPMPEPPAPEPAEEPTGVAPRTEREIAEDRLHETVAEDGVKRFVTARTSAGSRRPVERVATDGLIDELDQLFEKTQSAVVRSQYRRADSDGASDTMFSKVTVADRKGGGPSKQAKALKNLQDFEAMQAEIESELKSRGLTDEDITDGLAARYEAKQEREGIVAHGLSGARRVRPKASDAPLRRFPVPGDASYLHSGPFDHRVTGHADYAAAKGGDSDAAARVVRDLTDPATLTRAQASFGPDVIYTAPVAAEAKGDNAIPQALAEYYAAATGARTDTEIVQSNAAGHTGSDLMERLVSPARFDGPVERGQKYVLVDDNITSGGTIAALADHIRRGGGQVAGVVSLANASRSGQFAPRPHVVRELERRFGNDIRSEFQAEPAALTRDEADYLIGFRSADELRGRAATAREARAERTRRAGVRPPASGGGEGSGPREHGLAVGRGEEKRRGSAGRAAPSVTRSLSDTEASGPSRSTGRGEDGAEGGATQAIVKAAESVAKVGRELREIFAPASMTPQSEAAAAVVRHRAGELALHNERARHLLEQLGKVFKGMPDEDRLEFISAVELGHQQHLRPALKAVADEMRFWLDNTRDEIRELGTGKLEQWIENYFPHIWAEPEKAKEVIGQIVAKRPLEGTKSFLKKRTIPTTRDGIAAGLKPISTNPVELVLLKLREMNRYLMAQRVLADFKAKGLARYVPALEKAPDGYARIDDKVAMVYGPPEIEIQEAFDGLVRQGLNDAIARLDAISPLTHERRPNIGGKRLGYALSSGDYLATKFGGTDEVLMHELGHILDFRYKLWEKLTGTEGVTGVLADKLARRVERGERSRHQAINEDNQRIVSARRSVREELRALADLRFEKREATTGKTFKKYVRNKYEKTANAVHALLYAPERMEEVAPTVKRRLENFLKSKPELAPLLEIKPSLVVDTATAKVPLGGLLVKGQYWAPVDVARILNNYLSPGLRGRSAIYDAYMGLGNTLNQAQLSLSAFHLGFTSLDAATSQVALGLKEAATGAGGRMDDVSPGAATREMVRGLNKILTYPLAPFTTAIRGNRVLRAYLTGRNGGADTARMVDAIVRAGGRVKMDDFYKNNAIDAFMRAFRDRRGLDRAIGVGAHAFSAALEAATKPIMEWVVPRQKLGVFAAMAEYELRRLGPNAKRDEVNRALQRAWDSVDNRLGQMVYDNLFWKKALKDWSMASVRAVGWNLGTLREIGGGVKDLVAEGIKKAKGEDAEFTHPMSYIPGLMLVVMTAGALAQYLLTGEGPKELKDYFFPRTGRKNKEGNDERVQLPTYLKDIVSYVRHPIRTLEHKLHPVLGLIADMVHNEDFFGDQIRNEDDPLVVQLQQLSEYLATQYTSFSVRNAAEEGKRDQGPAEKAGGFFGVTAAPREEVRTPAQNKMAEILARRGHRSRTPEEVDAGGVRREVLDSLRAGTLSKTDIQRKIRRGDMTPGQGTQAIVSATQDPLLVKFKQLSIDEAEAVWRLADDREKEIWRRALERKRRIAARLGALAAEQDEP